VNEIDTFGIFDMKWSYFKNKQLLGTTDSENFLSVYKLNKNEEIIFEKKSDDLSSMCLSLDRSKNM
jgi:hypothetical protein